MKLIDRGPRLTPRPRVARRALALAGSAAAITLAGCGAAPVASSSHPPGATRAGTATASPSKGSPPAATRAQRAKAEAADMLKAFAPPPGAREVTASPVPSSPLSKAPARGGPQDDDAVTVSAWWLAPGRSGRLLSWEAAHIRAPYHRNGQETFNGVQSDDYMISAVPGLFDERQLTVSAVAAGHGQVAIRVDALVDWIPARAAGDTVPATAKVAVLTYTKGDDGKPPVLATRTLTSPQQVGKLAAYLNGLPVSVPGVNYESCPFDSGGGLAIVFTARLGGPALAKATASLTGCAFVRYTMPGRPETGLGEADAGQGLLAAANHVTGLRWKIP
jgi:hypothetical protein